MTKVLLIVTGLYFGTFPPGEIVKFELTSETRNQQECQDRGAKWSRRLRSFGAEQILVRCKPMGR